MSLARRLEKLLVGQDDLLPKNTSTVVAVGETLAPDLKTASPQSERVAKLAAHNLHKYKNATGVFLGRGYPEHVEIERSEAAAMFEVAEKTYNFGHLRLRDRKIVMEEISHDTHGNAVALKCIMEENGGHSVVVVTQQLHMKRVRRTFRRVMPDTEGYDICVVAAWSNYGGSSKWVYKNFWTFLLWDRIIAWAAFLSKLKNGPLANHFLYPASPARPPATL